MTLSKYEKPFTVHLKEIEQKINESSEYREILAEARKKYKKNKGKHIWMEVQDVPIEHLVLNSRVQRSFIMKHAMNTIIDKFDSRFCSLPICIKKADDHYEMDDGQHGTTSKCLIDGDIKTLKCLVIKTDDKFFGTRLFKCHNRTGIQRANDYTIWKNDVYDYEEALKDPNELYCQEILGDSDWINAYNVKVAADEAGIEIIDKPRKNTGFYFSHIKGIIDSTAKVGPKIMGQILTAYKNVWCEPLSERKVDNGMIFGMANIYLEVSNYKARYLDTYPPNWIEIVFRTLKSKMGHASNIHHGAQSQAYERLRAWNVDTHMPTAIRDFWQWCASPELKNQIKLPYNEDVSNSLRIWPQSRANLVETLKFENETVSK